MAKSECYTEYIKGWRWDAALMIHSPPRWVKYIVGLCEENPQLTHLRIKTLSPVCWSHWVSWQNKKKKRPHLIPLSWLCNILSVHYSWARCRLCPSQLIIFLLCAIKARGYFQRCFRWREKTASLQCKKLKFTLTCCRFTHGQACRDAE